MENETLKVIMNRASLRSYDPAPLTKEEEDTIISAAMQAPTAGNQMLYSIIIIRDKKKQEALSVLCDNQGFINKAPFLMVFVADQHRWFDYYRMNGVEEYCNKENRKYADVGTGDLVLSIEDTMAAAENAVIAGESLGIGSCYIGDVIENYEKVKALLELPKETFPIALLCFGHYKEDYKKVMRKRFDRKFVVFEDSYKQLTEEEYNEMFSERAQQGYFEKNTFNAKNFAQQFYARKMADPFRHEMNRSVEAGIKDWNSKK